MEVLLLKLNGWPATYDERIHALAQSTDITFIRSASIDHADNFRELENVSLFEVYPKRGSYVSPGWLKPFVFTAHVTQAILIAIFLTLVRRRRPEVVHAMDYVLGGIAAVVVASLLSRPLIVSVRGYKEPVYRSIMREEGTRKSKINYWILVTLSKLVLSQADFIITKAEYQKDAVRNVIDSSPGFHTVPTGVDFEKFDPAFTKEDDYLEKIFPDQYFGSSENQFRLLYFGQVIPQKGVDTLLQHIRDESDNLPDELVVVIVGEFRSESFCQEIDRLKHDVDREVLVYPDRVPFDDVPRLLSSVDTVALLSEPSHEGVPRVLQEACAMGVPIIAADVKGIKGAFSGLPGSYLVDRNDSISFASAVKEIYTNPPDMDREMLKDDFDINHNYHTYVNIYRKCLPSDGKNNPNDGASQ